MGDTTINIDAFCEACVKQVVQPLIFITVMVSTYRHLFYSLKIDKNEPKAILADLNNYYYHNRKAKMKFGRPQEQNGEIKYRDLYPSIHELKTIQKKINVFLQKIQLPDYVYGSVKGRNNIMNAEVHFGNKYFLLVDLKNYFTKISHHQVFDTFLYFGFSHDVARMLTQLTTYNGCLPQGAPTSPVIANLVFVKTGLKLFDKAQLNNLTFTTYLDDLTFSSRNDFKELIPEILQEIKSNRFFLNYNKIRYRKDFAEVTGVLLSPKGMTVESDMQERSKESRATKNYTDRVKASGQAALKKLNSQRSR
ncbi:reverse transcriptase family protein [Danxiaibacter flavus]|uniref:RNA-directed DNA polymerase n=1 Tax=Danxiaibacter flavus TaxID=3049108 RepID=A0ABV3ZK10_9BACT|nr:reverse transcriptase family protein [Chitinophagaceae bacterium DXS]